MKRTLFAPLLTAGFILTAPQANALYDGWFDTYFAEAAFDTTLRQNQRNYENWYGNSGSSKTTKNVAAQKGVAKYNNDSRITEEIDAKMIDALRQHLQSIGKYSEDSEQQLTQLQNSYLISRVKNALLSDGYDANSIATAMAYVTAINYGITQHLDLSSVKAHPMVGQIQDAMDKDSYLRNLSDADKQRIADTYYWIGSLQMAMYMEAANAGDQQALNNLAKEANAVLTSFGLSTAQIREGSNGLEIHR